MIISPKYKFVFIATPKTGSTTIHKTLLNCVKDKNLINESKVHLGSKHKSCPKLIEQYPQYKDYFKFAFVRNPWDRVVSWYSKKKDTNTISVSFKKFLSDYEYLWARLDQTAYKFTKGCDFIGKTENIQQDFDIICDKIKIPKQKLLRKNKSKHKHYTKYYNEETRQIVAKKYAKDIEYFGYEFGK